MADGNGEAPTTSAEGVETSTAQYEGQTDAQAQGGESQTPADTSQHQEATESSS
jgi:hypothetical protein